MIRKNFFQIIFILALGSLIYFNSLHNPLIFDDVSYIDNNPSIYHLENFTKIKNWYGQRFVGTFTFALNYALGGINPFGYHVVNVVIHLLTTILVLFLMQLILALPKFSKIYSNNQISKISFLIAILFLVHPVQVQTVGYITQRYSSLSALFFVAGLISYILARVAKNFKSISIKHFFLFVVFGLLGMATKQTVIVLPVIVLFLEWFFIEPNIFTLAKSNLALRLCGWSLLGLLLVVPIMHRLNFLYIFGAQFSSHSHDGDQITSVTYLLTQFRVLVTYLKILFFPIGLKLDYDFALSHSLFEIQTFLSFIILASVVALSFKNRQRFPLMFLGVAWFFITLLVESSIIPIPHVIFEYRLYLPMVGFAIFLTAALVEIIKRPKVFYFVSAFLIILFSWLSVYQNYIWSDEVIFWTDAVMKAPNKSRPYNNLAVAYIDRGDYKMAIKLLQIAKKKDPSSFETLNNLALAYMNDGNLKMAKIYFDKSLEILPTFNKALNNLGVLYRRENNLPKAKELFIRALKTDYKEPALNLASVYIEEGSFEQAVNILEQQLYNYPHEEETLKLLLSCYLKNNQQEKINEVFMSELKSNHSIEFLTLIASSLASKGMNHLAERFYVKAMAINSKYAEIYLEYGKFLGNQNKFREAIDVWRRGKSFHLDDKRFDELILQAEKLMGVS